MADRTLGPCRAAWCNTDEPGRKAMDQNDRKRRRVQRLAETAEPLLPETRPGPGRGHKGRVKTWHDHYGNSNVYLTRRIARDRPDILARMTAGEFTSVRDAAPEERLAIREQLATEDET